MGKSRGVWTQKHFVVWPSLRSPLWEQLHVICNLYISKWGMMKYAGNTEEWCKRTELCLKKKLPEK